MLTKNLGYPRIGSQRQLKKASDNYWAGKSGQNELNEVARKWTETKAALQNMVAAAKESC